MIGRDTLDRYELALGRLRANDREAIHLKIELDLPSPEIARFLRLEQSSRQVTRKFVFVP